MIIESPVYINPVAIKIGSFPIYWYGIMYLVGLFLTYHLCIYNISKSKLKKITNKELEEFLYYGIIAAIIGGRLGYILIYNFDYFYNNLLEIFCIRNGGMSFHGGLIGSAIMIFIYSKIKKISFWTISDLLVTSAPLAIAVGRIGNFINGELCGRPTTVPWGIIFAKNNDGIYRHPSQLYECIIEGPLLFLIMMFFFNKNKKEGCTSAIFLISYGILRFIAEIWREPELTLIIKSVALSMGQLLSIPMIAIGIILLFFLRK